MPVFLVWGPSVTQNSPFLPQHQRQYTLNIPTKGSLDYRGHSKFTSLIVYKDSSRRFALTRTFYDVLIQHRVVHVLDPSTDFIGLDWVWNPFSKMLLLSFKICILVAFNIYIWTFLDQNAILIACFRGYVIGLFMTWSMNVLPSTAV